MSTNPLDLDLDAMWEEAGLEDAPPDPILSKMPPQANEDEYTRMTPEWMDAREYNRNWAKAYSLAQRGEPYEHLLDRHPVTNKATGVVSQVVTDDAAGHKTSNRLIGQSDRVRSHLRAQLHAAKRRAKREGNPDLVHQPWLDNIDKLYDFAGLPPNHDTPTDGRVYKFTQTDTSGGFNPDNTEWLSTDAIQMRLSTRRVLFEGEDISLTELAKRCGLSVATVRARYDAGIRGERLWSGRRLNSKYNVNINGAEVSLPQFAKMCGISVVTLRARMARGLTGDALVSKEDLRTKGRRLKYNSDTPEDTIREEMKALTLKYQQAQQVENPNPREVGAIFDELMRAKRKLEDLKFRLKALDGGE